MSKRELSLKPSCAHEIHGLGAKDAAILWEKIGFLLTDPHPDGQLKKKLQGHKGLYRLRVGDHRVFYSYGDSWVRLLAIRLRSEAYGKKNEAIEASAPAHVPSGAEEELAGEPPETRRPPAFTFEAKTPVPQAQANPLPRKITTEWLSSLKVPEDHWGRLLGCATDAELLASGVPDGVLQRLVDNLYPKPLTEVAEQPNLSVGDVGDLIRFKEGTLTSFLLELDAEQTKLIDWALRGPTLVRGGAGTGKSTVALYRVRALLRAAKARGDERVLFATYTTTLKAVSEQLLDQLLTASERKRVRVGTCDELAREICSTYRRVGAPLQALSNLLRSVREGLEPPGATPLERKLRAKALEKLSDDYLLDEFVWVIEGRALRTLDEYQQAPRPGRSVAFGPKVREAVWALWEAYQARVASQEQETFAGLRREALERVLAAPERHAYDYVLIDEAQDLTPVALRLMARLARSAEGLFFAADDKQSLYARGYGYSAVDERLQFRGRTAILERNYRSTEEIDRAAFALLTPEEGQALEPSISPHHGPQPILLRGVKPGDEPRWAAKFLQEMGRFLRVRPGAAAVLVSDRSSGEVIVAGLNGLGIDAVFCAGGQIDLDSTAVKVMTIHAAKGLEFPSVVVAGLGRKRASSETGEPGEQEEALRRRRRLLYVGATRAMRGLMVMQRQGDEGETFDALPADRWSIVNVGT